MKKNKNYLILIKIIKKILNNYQADYLQFSIYSLNNSEIDWEKSKNYIKCKQKKEKTLSQLINKANLYSKYKLTKLKMRFKNSLSVVKKEKKTKNHQLIFLFFFLEDRKNKLSKIAKIFWIEKVNYNVIWKKKLMQISTLLQKIQLITFNLSITIHNSFNSDSRKNDYKKKIKLLNVKVQNLISKIKKI